MYLIFIALGLCAVYFFLYFLFPIFFQTTITRPNKKSAYSLVYIFAFSLISYFIALQIGNEWIGNRIIHILGGGAASFFMCFRVIKDTDMKIGRFQFFVFSFLIVTALGVGNELVEFFLQHFFHIIFAPTITDTWLDLLSNTIGILLGAAVLVPFVKSHKSNS